MKNSTLIYFIIAVILLTSTLVSHAKEAPELTTDYSEFVKKMVDKHQFDKQTLTTLLNTSTRQPSILRAMSSPAEKRLEWHTYRKIFLKPSRINGGIKFWQQNKEQLTQAQQKYGVPEEIIVAIIGVETRYGSNTGSYKVLDALTTLGFHYPKRAAFFRRELEHFLLLAREEGFDPSKPKGSYAGAMGKPQFISSSYRAYAVDGDNDSKRDLWTSSADIIHSVANYFSRHGWSDSPLIAQKTKLTGETYRELLSSSLKPVHTLGELSQHHVQVPLDQASDTLVKLLELKQPKHSDYWLTFGNFYTITRYNHSHLYAMAVYQLSQEIKQGYHLATL